MNNYQDWAQLVAKKLQGEADIIAAIEKDELDDAAATDAFARAVLEPFLPENFGVGSGRVVDAFGNYSDELDLIVYNRDFPRIGMRGVHATYLYESVLACFAVRAKFVRKTFFDCLDACASLADLETNVDKQVMTRLAAKNGMKVGPNNTFTHDDALRTARFELIGRPPAFVFGFSGFKYSYRQLQENIELWLDNRQQEDLETPMKALPGVIATQGCFAWRNAAPLALSNREMLGIGADEAPVRLIVLQLLYLLNRRLNVTADGYGLKPSLKAYLNQFDEPHFEVGIGKVAHSTRPARPRQAQRPGTDSEADRAARDTGRFQIARDRAQPGAEHPTAEHPTSDLPTAEHPTSDLPTAEVDLPPPTGQVKAAAKTRPQPEPQRPPASAPRDAARAPTIETRPSAPPFGSAPIPPRESRPAAPPLGSAPIPNTLGKSAVPGAGKPPAAPLGSAPIPPMQNRPATAPLGSAPIPPKQSSPATAPLGSAPIPPKENRPAAAPLGSAPIPPKQSGPATAPLGSAPIPPKENRPAAAPLGSAPIPPKQSKPATAPRPVAEVIPKKPPIDIDIGAEAASGDDATEEDVLANTVIIPPPEGGKPAADKPAAEADDKPRNSTNDFIARVKRQLANSERQPDQEPDFTTTIPQ